MQDEVARARELDQFASAHDAQLGFTLCANRTAWSPGYVQQSASSLGFVTGAIPGRMVLPASQPGHAPILGLSFDTQAAMADDPEQTALRELTLSLDVPQVLRSEQPFARMCELAIALAGSMDGVITDDNGQILPKDAMDAIGGELEGLYDTLEQRDLAAGSALAAPAPAPAPAAPASVSHFFMKLVLAAPDRVLPFLSMALASQAAWPEPPAPASASH